MVKLFAYLDEYKMYSASSQIFEGLTEHIISYANVEHKGEEKQKGPFGSGRILADIAAENVGREEKKFLYDYAYTLFEKKLLEDNQVLVVDEDSVAGVQEKTVSAGFIKVSGRVVFHDMRSVTRTLSGLNELNEAFAYVARGSSANSEIAELRDAVQKAKGAEKVRLRESLDQKLRSIQPDNRLDSKYVEQLGHLLKYGYEDQLELRFSFARKEANPILFSAVLDRDFLRESEAILIRKYARQTEKRFTLFGVVTQAERAIAEPTAATDGALDTSSLKSATSGVITQLTVLEDQFFGRLPDEVIVDPIAVYRQL